MLRRPGVVRAFQRGRHTFEVRIDLSKEVTQEQIEAALSHGLGAKLVAVRRLGEARRLTGYRELGEESRRELAERLGRGERPALLAGRIWKDVNGFASMLGYDAIVSFNREVRRGRVREVES